VCTLLSWLCVQYLHTTQLTLGICTLHNWLCVCVHYSTGSVCVHTTQLTLCVCTLLNWLCVCAHYPTGSVFVRNTQLALCVCTILNWLCVCTLLRALCTVCAHYSHGSGYSTCTLLNWLRVCAHYSTDSVCFCERGKHGISCLDKHLPAFHERFCTLKMEVAGSTEAFVPSYQSTQCYDPEEHDPNVPVMAPSEHFGTWEVSSSLCRHDAWCVTAISINHLNPSGYCIYHLLQRTGTWHSTRRMDRTDGVGNCELGSSGPMAGSTR
jgi:hypothetical protein